MARFLDSESVFNCRQKTKYGPPSMRPKSEASADELLTSQSTAADLHANTDLETTPRRPLQQKQLTSALSHVKGV